MKETKTSEQWTQIKQFVDANITISDPDGWDRKNFQYSFYEEQITYEEFLNRLYRSTVSSMKNLLDLQNSSDKP